MCPCALQKCTIPFRSLSQYTQWWYPHSASTGFTLGGKKLGVAPTTGASTMENPALHPDPGVLTSECSLCIFQKKTKQDWLSFFCFLHAPPWTSAGLLLLSWRLKRSESLVVWEFRQSKSADSSTGVGPASGCSSWERGVTSDDPQTPGSVWPRTAIYGARWEETVISDL